MHKLLIVGNYVGSYKFALLSDGGEGYYVVTGSQEERPMIHFIGQDHGEG